MSDRLVLVTTSPRVAPGLLSAAAWSTLQEAGSVRAAADHPLLPYLRDAPLLSGLRLGLERVDDPRALARRLTSAVHADGVVVWLVGADGDARLGHELGQLASTGEAPEIELLPGSYDLPGARLIDLVTTMDRLRSVGGCPWDAEQTHESLATYLLEETYETLEAIETGDREHLREELGDLLLQVVFHSRIAAEHPDRPWSVDDVAGDIVDKLVRRHPHVFAADAGTTTTAAAVEAGWHTAKAAEKGRGSALDGVPIALPALSLIAKLMHRAEAHGVHVEPPEDASIASRLVRLAAEARAAGMDAEGELRRAARDYTARVRAAEHELAAGTGFSQRTQET